MKATAQVSDLFKLCWSARCCFVSIFSKLQTWPLKEELVTRPLKQSRRETSQSSAGHRIFHSSGNPKFHYHIYKCPPPVPVLSHTDPVHAPTSLFLKIILISSHLHMNLPSSFFPSGFHTKKLYTPLLFPIRATGTGSKVKYMVRSSSKVS